MQNPLAHTINEACARSGVGRTALYELINTGQLPARKRGRRTLILDDDLVRYVQSLPLIVKQSGSTPLRDSTTDRKVTDNNAGEMPSVRKCRGVA
jgi:excisionase family DNA binding protein